MNENQNKGLKNLSKKVIAVVSSALSLLIPNESKALPQTLIILIILSNRIFKVPLKKF